MTQFKVTTPVPGTTGVHAGVNFTNGEAVVDDDTHGPSLHYFRAAGYGVEDLEPAEPAEESTVERPGGDEPPHAPPASPPGPELTPTPGPSSAADAPAPDDEPAETGDDQAAVPARGRKASTK